MNDLYGPNGAMCCECLKWGGCLVSFIPEWNRMKVINTFKNEPYIGGGTFKMVKCEDYTKEAEDKQ